MIIENPDNLNSKKYIPPRIKMIKYVCSKKIILFFRRYFLCAVHVMFYRHPTYQQMR